MSVASRSLALLFAAAVVAAVPAALPAAEPELLPQKTFDARIEGGILDLTFVLALSEVSNYPVTVTAISGSIEEQLYEGVLQEGLYRLRAPITKITSGPVKIVLRTRVTHRTRQGPENYLRYVSWEGTLNR